MAPTSAEAGLFPDSPPHLGTQSRGGPTGRVRAGSGMGPPQGEMAPRLGPFSPEAGPSRPGPHRTSLRPRRAYPRIFLLALFL
eukprot:CAMPEP_0180210248 /NCGR_PEP_ID=MMETSP0987-20121128/12000_1 /TAXON_ID=697907 /ORGANISM="non described non described, Strain CCMP2293" /LENGTH=82 /DNA_ID=CAMNT_0022167105 /DNA_START=1 /DNA_END=249 /DNA_ORIENTATION=-